tara:strand:- start:365 stop:622 length:258 start_codon:yes stop_codon:yes gene_type:complete
VKTVKSFILAAAALCITLSAPQSAWACPACAGNNDGGTTYIIILGLMILLPFGVTYIVYRLLKQGEANEKQIIAQFADVSEGRTP